MATITLRSAKGSPLTNNEVDANFTNLNTAKYEANDNISVGTIAGSTLTLTGNATFQGTTTLSASAAVSAAGTTQGAATALTARRCCTGPPRVSSRRPWRTGSLQQQR